jgi:hypothetical protein
MSFTISPVPESYAAPAVIETEGPHDRHHAQPDAERRRHHHPSTGTPASGDAPASAPQPVGPSTIGTLIDIRASAASPSIGSGCSRSPGVLSRVVCRGGVEQAWCRGVRGLCGQALASDARIGNGYSELGLAPRSIEA